MSEKSSTRMISRMRCSGDLSKIECTVRNRTDHASLWKHTITEVCGRLSRYLPGFLHLEHENDHSKLTVRILTSSLKYSQYLFKLKKKKLIIIN